MKIREVFNHILVILLAELIVIFLGSVLQLVFGKNSEDMLRLFLNLKVPVWAIFSVLLLGYPLFRLFYRIKRSNKSLLKNTNLGNGVFFHSDYSDYYDYDFRKEKLWDNTSKSSIGNIADAEITFEGKLLNVKRTNKDGRVILKISNYKNDGKILSRIQKNLEKSTRNIEVSFEAKYIGTAVDIYVIFQRYGTYSWIDSQRVNIDDINWKTYSIKKKIPSNEDFIIRLEEKDCRSVPCNYQIRKIVIKEV